MVLIAGVLPGLLPALQATRRNLVSSMRLGAPRRWAADRGRAACSSWRRSPGRRCSSPPRCCSFAASGTRTRSISDSTANQLVVAQLEPSLYGFEGARAESFAREVVDRVCRSAGHHSGARGSRAVRGRIPADRDRVDELARLRRPVVQADRVLCRRPASLRGARLAASRGARVHRQRPEDAAARSSSTRRWRARLWPGQSPLGQSRRTRRRAAPRRGRRRRRRHRTWILRTGPRIRCSTSRSLDRFRTLRVLVRDDAGRRRPPSRGPRRRRTPSRRRCRSRRSRR